VNPTGPVEAPVVARRVDIRDAACPLTWVRTRVALDAVAQGEALEVLLLAGEPLESVPRTAEEEGHRVVLREPWPAGGEGAWRLVLEKGAPTGASRLMP
jgi:TusA-related sulfurtransferase